MQGVEELAYLVKANPSVRKATLLAAIYNGTEDDLHILLSAGLDLKDPVYLEEAIQRGDAVIIETLLEAGCPASLKALCHAIRKENQPLIQHLVTMPLNSLRPQTPLSDETLLEQDPYTTIILHGQQANLPLLFKHRVPPAAPHLFPPLKACVESGSVHLFDALLRLLREDKTMPSRTQLVAVLESCLLKGRVDMTRYIWDCLEPDRPIPEALYRFTSGLGGQRVPAADVRLTPEAIFAPLLARSSLEMIGLAIYFVSQGCCDECVDDLLLTAANCGCVLSTEVSLSRGAKSPYAILALIAGVPETDIAKRAALEMKQLGTPSSSTTEKEAERTKTPPSSHDVATSNGAGEQYTESSPTLTPPRHDYFEVLGILLVEGGQANAAVSLGTVTRRCWHVHPSMEGYIKENIELTPLQAALVRKDIPLINYLLNNSGVNATATSTPTSKPIEPGQPIKQQHPLTLAHMMTELTESLPLASLKADEETCVALDRLLMLSAEKDWFMAVKALLNLSSMAALQNPEYGDWSPYDLAATLQISVTKGSAFVTRSIMRHQLLAQMSASTIAAIKAQNGPMVCTYLDICGGGDEVEEWLWRYTGGVTSPVWHWLMEVVAASITTPDDWSVDDDLDGHLHRGRLTGLYEKMRARYRFQKNNTGPFVMPPPLRMLDKRQRPCALKLPSLTTSPNDLNKEEAMLPPAATTAAFATPVPQLGAAPSSFLQPFKLFASSSGSKRLAKRQGEEEKKVARPPLTSTKAAPSSDGVSRLKGAHFKGSPLRHHVSTSELEASEEAQRWEPKRMDVPRSLNGHRPEGYHEDMQEPPRKRRPTEEGQYPPGYHGHSPPQHQHYPSHLQSYYPQGSYGEYPVRPPHPPMHYKSPMASPDRKQGRSNASLSMPPPDYPYEAYRAHPSYDYNTRHVLPPLHQALHHPAPRPTEPRPYYAYPPPEQHASAPPLYRGEERPHRPLEQAEQQEMIPSTVAVGEVAEAEAAAAAAALSSLHQAAKPAVPSQPSSPPGTVR